MTDTAKSASAAVAQLQSQLGLQTGGSPQEGQRAMSLSNCTCTCFSSLGMWCLESKVSFFSNLWWLEPLLLVCLNQKIPKSSHVRLCPCLTSLPLMHRSDVPNTRADQVLHTKVMRPWTLAVSAMMVLGMVVTQTRGTDLSAPLYQTLSQRRRIFLGMGARKNRWWKRHHHRLPVHSPLHHPHQPQNQKTKRASMKEVSTGSFLN